MLTKHFITVFSFMSLFISCMEEKHFNDPLELVLASENPNIKRVMDSIDQFELQIIYSQIDRRNDSILFTDYTFQLDENNYFYPASTVKFPTAVLALEKLNKIDTLDRKFRYYIEGDSIENSFAEDLIKIFAVSDNHANNRLFEFLGQDAINDGLKAKGVVPVRISHRLGFHTDDVTTKPLVIYLNDSTTTTTEPIINSEPIALDLQKIRKGIAHYKDEELLEESFDFSMKNYYPLKAQHALLKRIIFPENFAENQRFNLNKAQRAFLLKAMQTLPKNAGYNAVEYYDSYCKFFMFGDKKENIPEYFKIYNKVGFAYGTLTECAYITDSKNNIEFMLTATILVNKDGVFNDNVYEYDDIGIPFLAQLGRELYTYELKRGK